MKAECRTTEYEPFGPEWEKMMMRFPKKFLIEFAKRNCQENQKLQNRLQSSNEYAERNGLPKF